MPAAEPQPTRKARDDTKLPQQKNCGGYSRLQEGTDGRNPGGLDGTYERQLSAACQNLSANLELALESERFGVQIAKQQGKYNARYPTLADRYPNSDHYPAMAFWRASLIDRIQRRLRATRAKPSAAITPPSHPNRRFIATALAWCRRENISLATAAFRHPAFLEQALPQAPGQFGLPRACP